MDGVRATDTDLAASFDQADLRQVDLTGAVLPEALFYGANLQSATLRQVALEGAQLSGANLEGADLTNAYLGDAVLLGARVSAEQLVYANTTQGTVLDPDICEGLQRLKPGAACYQPLPNEAFR